MGQYVCRYCGKVLEHFEAEKVVVLYVEPNERCCQVCVQEDE
ncbi:MAG: GapA-binding peptide SR1P [Candidatus Carbobacillus altaicus]|nr:GapA-binding peptide SR1P [Candidatus Carbobacillus altaicus]